MNLGSSKPSYHDLPPLERGGVIARRGFDFQDHIAAQAARRWVGSDCHSADPNPKGKITITFFSFARSPLLIIFPFILQIRVHVISILMT